MAGRWIFALTRNLVPYDKWFAAIWPFCKFWSEFLSDRCDILSQIEYAVRRENRTAYFDNGSSMALSTHGINSEVEQAAETAGAAADPAMQIINYV